MYFAERQRPPLHAQFPPTMADQTDGRTGRSCRDGVLASNAEGSQKEDGVANHEVSVDLIQLPERFKPLPKIQIGGEAQKWILCVRSVQIKLRIVDRMTRKFLSWIFPFNFKSATASTQPKIQVLNLFSHVRGDDFGAEEFP